MFHGGKVIRDPVHDAITFSNSKIDKLLLQLINSPEFQRLRRVRQLGFADMVYPAGVHTRFSHSIGTLQVARNVFINLKELEYPEAKIEENVNAFLISALLHDLGHGPFSHLFERIFGQKHEDWTIRIIKDESTCVNTLLRKHQDSLPEKVADLISKKETSFWSQLISSQLDCDRMDYLLRDNHMTGANYGLFDINWLIHCFILDEIRGEQVAMINHKGQSAVESYLIARFHMHRNVYFHKTIRAGEVMLISALKRAKYLYGKSELEDDECTHMLTPFFNDEEIPVQDYLYLDDVSITTCIKRWKNSKDSELGMLCKGIIERQLLKVIEIPYTYNLEELIEFIKKAERIVGKKGYDPAYFCLHDEPTDSPYKPYRPDTDELLASIYIKTLREEKKEISDVSKLARSLSESKYKMKRLYVPSDCRDEIEKLLI
jgi:HD superfamily phosphohydrolase